MGGTMVVDGGFVGGGVVDTLVDAVVTCVVGGTVNGLVDWLMVRHGVPVTRASAPAAAEAPSMWTNPNDVKVVATVARMSRRRDRDMGLPPGRGGAAQAERRAAPDAPVY